MATGIQWTDETWNPTVGCDRRSPGCAQCYAKKLHDKRHKAVLAGKNLAPQYRQPFEVVQLMPDRLETPLGWRRPRMVFVDSVSDLFYGDEQDRIQAERAGRPFNPVPFEFVDQVFDVMWKCPQHTFQILTKRVRRMVEYIRERASRRQFGWTDWERMAIAPGAAFTIDDIRMRNQCGFVGDGEWACDHPLHGGQDNTCDERDCPIASSVDEREKLEAIGVADEHTYGSDGYAEDSQWMSFHTRPPRAACGNVWLGFSAENQRQFDDRMRYFRALRWILGPHFTLFASLEPLLGPIDFTIKYWPGDDDERAPWNALSRYDFQHGQQHHLRPHLDWVIVGGPSNDTRPFEVEWAWSVLKQCRAAGVPAFMKQFGSRPLVPACRQTHWDYGRFIKKPEHKRFTEHSPDLWRMHLTDLKGGDPKEWPPNFRVRQFPTTEPRRG